MRRLLFAIFLVLPLALHAQSYTGARNAAGNPHGAGRLVDAQGDLYEGEFVDGVLNGRGRAVHRTGAVYEGNFREGVFSGQGVLRMPNGDEYRGSFERGAFNGPGTLGYGKPRPDGPTEVSGIWKDGRLDDSAERLQAAVGVELALHRQRPLLDEALAALLPSRPGRINLYLLAVAGDGAQEVFRREVEFVREQFDSHFGTRGRSVALVNSRNTMDSAPMATVTSIREALKAIAAKMDRQNDILFVYLTSHASKEHELALNQVSMLLRGLKPADLAQLLKESGVRWKAVVVSACYAGAFIEPLRDERTLAIAAARQDRMSFGCAEENDFTYFGRAFFKEALASSKSFDEAFGKAAALVGEWETRDRKTGPEASLPQIHNPKPISDQLRRWWSQSRP